MKRLLCSIAASVAAGLSAASATAEPPNGSPPAVMGEMIDADVPATYRLPRVPASAEFAVSPDFTSIPLPMFAAPLTPALGWPVPAIVELQKVPAGTATDSDSDDSLMDAGDGVESLAIDIPAGEPHVAHTKPQAEMPIVASVPVIDLTAQLLPAVQRGFGLSQRGAMYAARTEFVQVLRRVAQARDAAAKTSEHSRALAAGLRSLDEAEDFVPDGVQLEAELDVRRAASSHRTSVLPAESEEVSPMEAVALYHEFARQQLKAAIAGEQAGSMALHGLGTVYAQLAARNDDDVQLTQGAMTMYSAALAACPDNHLAANELGVLVCRGGRAEEAAALFMQTIDFAPSAVAYHNLAMAQQRCGRMAEAAANELESQRWAAQERARGEVSRRAGVHWVSPEEMARASQPIQRTTAPMNQPVSPPLTPPSPPAKSTWQRVVESTKSLPLPGGKAKENLGPMPAERFARPMEMGTGNQRQWR